MVRTPNAQSPRKRLPSSPRSRDDARETNGGLPARRAEALLPATVTLAPVAPAARDALYAEFQPLVRRLIRQYGEDPELRQDLEGEIYVRFCQLLEQYDPSRSIPLKAYLIRTLPPSVYTYARKHWRRQHREYSVDQEPERLPAAPLSDPIADWEAQWDSRVLLRALPTAIAKLPLRQRQVVIWRYYEGHAFE